MSLPFAAMQASTLSINESTSFCSVSCGILAVALEVALMATLAQRQCRMAILAQDLCRMAILAQRQCRMAIMAQRQCRMAMVTRQLWHKTIGHKATSAQDNRSQGNIGTRQ